MIRPHPFGSAAATGRSSLGSYSRNPLDSPSSFKKLTLRMKRRNTVSVTPAIGASTVAGRSSTLPMRTDPGTRAVCTTALVSGTGFSKCFFIRFYSKADTAILAALEVKMNRLREVLLQQYIGAIAIGFLIVNAVTYVAISVAQVLSWVFLRHSPSVMQPIGFNWGP